MTGKRTRSGEPINWEKVRRRLAQAIRATEEALTLSPERGREEMEKRARALARTVEARAEAAAALEVIVFALANETYALETRHVREVVRLTDLTPLPGAPEFLTGVTNLRGQVLAVIDLRRFFGVAVRGLSDLARVVVLGDERAEFGVLADAVLDIVRLTEAELREPPATVAGVAAEYLRGVTGTALLLLDGAVLLRDPRLVVDQAEEPGA